MKIGTVKFFFLKSHSCIYSSQAESFSLRLDLTTEDRNDLNSSILSPFFQQFEGLLLSLT